MFAAGRHIFELCERDMLGEGFCGAPQDAGKLGTLRVYKWEAAWIRQELMAVKAGLRMDRTL